MDLSLLSGLSEISAEDRLLLVESAFSSIFRKINSDFYSNGRSNQMRAAGRYHFIPMNTNSMVKVFCWLKEHYWAVQEMAGFGVYPHKRWQQGLKFVDAGCGAGNILLLAEASGLFSECVGLEVDLQTLRLGKKIVSSGKRNPLTGRTIIQKADILECKNWHEYDVIYYYHPLLNRVLEIKFEERIEDTAKPGAVIIPMMKSSRRIKKDERFQAIGADYGFGELYVKLRD